MNGPNPRKPEIDFLPQHYREQSKQRNRKLSRYVVLALFAALLAVPTLWQVRWKAGLARQVAELVPLADETEQERQRLIQAQDELRQLEARARLYVYLEHPWPATQLLAAAVADLPEEVQLRELRLFPEQTAPRRPTAAEAARRGAPPTPEELQAEQARPAAVKDLHALLAATEQRNLVLRLRGTTTNPAALHLFLGQLGNSRFFSRADLESLETGRGTSEGEPPYARFEAALTVRPAWRAHRSRSAEEAAAPPRLAMQHESAGSPAP